MPYPNEHSCRIKEPIAGAPTRRKNGEREHNGKKYDVIYQEQDGKWVDQAFRYPKGTWEASEARSHCDSNGGSFEAAEESSARSAYYTIRSKAEEEAEILLYGDIGESWFGEGNGAKQFVEALKEVKNVKRLSIRLNSGGGCVFDGMAIFNAIDRHSAKKTVYIDGLAASIASVIAMAGESVIIAENAMFMIHDPFGGVLGNATEMRTVADALDKIKEGMITSYQRKSRLPGAEISQMMTEETWMTAKEAFEKGFVTDIGKSMQMAASVQLDPRHYKKVPQSFLPRNRGDGPEADTMFQQLDAVKKKVNEGIFKERIFRTKQD